MKRRVKGKTSPASRSKKSRRKPKSIQQRAKDLTLRAIRQRKLNFGELSDVAKAMLKDVDRSVKNVLSASQRKALRQVVRGVEDAWAATAKASGATVRHAKRYGLPMAKRDIVQLGRRLSSLEGEFIDTVERQARRLGGDVGEELQSMSRQMKRAGTKIASAAETARRALGKNPQAAGREVAGAGIEAVRQGFHTLLSATGGVLEGAGKALRGASARRSKPR